MAEPSTILELSNGRRRSRTGRSRRERRGWASPPSRRPGARSRTLAAGGHAGQDLFGQIQTMPGQLRNRGCGLGALDEDVVDAHGHQIHADERCSSNCTANRGPGADAVRVEATSTGSPTLLTSS